MRKKQIKGLGKTWQLVMNSVRSWRKGCLKKLTRRSLWKKRKVVQRVNKKEWRLEKEKEELKGLVLF